MKSKRHIGEKVSASQAHPPIRYVLTAYWVI